MRGLGVFVEGELTPEVGHDLAVQLRQGAPREVGGLGIGVQQRELRIAQGVSSSWRKLH